MNARSPSPFFPPNAPFAPPALHARDPATLFRAALDQVRQLQLATPATWGAPAPACPPPP